MHYSSAQGREPPWHALGGLTEEVRAFVLKAACAAVEMHKDQTPEVRERHIWKRGNDGNFRMHIERAPILQATLGDAWLRALPTYQSCVDGLRTEPVIGQQVDRLIGTTMGAYRFEVDTVLKHLIDALIDADGHVVADSVQRFDSVWRAEVEELYSTNVTYKTISPLAILKLSSLPLRLNAEVSLDRFTDEEVTRCFSVGVIRPMTPTFPIIFDDHAVGVRKISVLPKLVRSELEQNTPAPLTSEGRFGSRPALYANLAVEDVLVALRLFKRAQISCQGHASWSNSWLSMGEATSYQLLGHNPGGEFEVSANEEAQFTQLWRQLEDGASRFAFSIHRFSLAFDRKLPADRIVDLVIAAEALLLSDMGEQTYRGEIRYRFALRAAKFIEHSELSELHVFRLMRRAYDARSAIVHGGSPKDTKLPTDAGASLQAFTDAIEDLVRLGLRRALSLGDDAAKLRQSEYWDDLVLSK